MEVQEANEIQKNWLQSSKNNNNIDLLIEIWNNRKPWIGDNLNVWNDLISWRQTYYSFLTLHNSNIHYINSIQVNMFKCCIILLNNVYNIHSMYTF